MPHSSFLIQKAKEFNISLDVPSGQLLVYKSMLLGMWQLLRNDLRKVVNNIDTLEKDLREICNELDDMRLAGEAIYFIHLGYIKSIDGILINVETAYNHIYAASRMHEDGGNDDAHFAVAKRLRECRHALQEAIQEFRIP